MFKWSVKVNKDFEKLERNIINFNDHIGFLEKSNKMLGLKLGKFRRHPLKSSNCET